MTKRDHRVEDARKEAKQVLRDGYDYVIGLKKSYGQVIPWVFTDEKEVDDLVIEPRYPLTKFTLLIEKAEPEKKIAIAARGCDERALRELHDLHMIDREAIGIVRIPCTPEEAAVCNCQKPIYDIEKCVGCQECLKACREDAITLKNPCTVLVPNEFDLGLGDRKAIYVPFPQAVPLKFTRDPDHCLSLTGKIECKGCKEVCEAEAILDSDEEELIDVQVGAIVVATGFDLYDATQDKRFGYGKLEGVITGLEFERLVSASGPTGGHIEVNGKEPKRVVFIQCVGSRDREGNRYCSRVCCMYTAKQAHLIREKIPDSEMVVYFTDMRAFGKGYEEFYNRVMAEGVEYRRRELDDTISVSKSRGGLVVRAEGYDDVKADLVILATGVVAREDSKELAKILNISVGGDGFFMEAHPKLRPVDTFTDGVFLAGCCQGPKDIPDSVAQASAAAAKACAILSKEKLLMEEMTAYVDEETCVGCGNCVTTCQFSAVDLQLKDGRKVAVVNSALCKGCGACAASCPSGAMQQYEFTDEQMVKAVRAVTGR